MKPHEVNVTWSLTISAETRVGTYQRWCWVFYPEGGLEGNTLVCTETETRLIIQWASWDLSKQPKLSIPGEDGAVLLSKSRSGSGTRSETDHVLGGSVVRTLILEWGKQGEAVMLVRRQMRHLGWRVNTDRQKENKDIVVRHRRIWARTDSCTAVRHRSLHATHF